MESRFKWQDFIRLLAFAFYPGITLLYCLIATVTIDVGLSIWLNHVDPASTTHSVLIAIITGISASFIVALVVELSNNYKNNEKASYELLDYFLCVTNYESMKRVLMMQTGPQRARAKAVEEYVAGGGVVDTDDADESPMDEAQIVWKQLPKIMPVLKDTLENKKAFLTNKEILALNNIAFYYEQIKCVIEMEMDELCLDTIMREPDEDILRHWLPQNILNALPPWFVKDLARNEATAARDSLIDKLMETSQYQVIMRDYPVGMQYTVEISHEDGREDDEPDEPKQSSFQSIELSLCCKEIAEDLDNLEQAISIRPFVGPLLLAHKGSDKRPPNGFVSNLVYKHTKQALIHRSEMHAEGTDNS